MLRLWARVKEIEPFQAELQLQKLACDYLRSLEAIKSQNSLYREFSNARFNDIISLNFDRRIALSFPRPQFKSGPAPCPEGSHGETLYRHDLLDHADGAQTRIWYPHGDTRKWSTLKLGVRKYGFYVGTISEAKGGHNPGYSDSWRHKRSWDQWDDLRRQTWEQRDGLRDNKLKSTSKRNQKPSRYLDPFLNGAIVFIGCGLSFDEWPLWSLLRIRATVSGRRPPAYLVTGGGMLPEQSCALAYHGIEILSYPSFDHMWDDLRSAIA
jgi:hypothetical protein